MREVCEFRVVERHASLLFGATEGTRLGDSIVGYTVRKIEIPTDDPRFHRIGEINEELSSDRNESFFHGWNLIRHYTKADLASAELFHLKITAVFEPPGRDCGTQYDYSDSCPECACPARQASALILDLRKAPKTRDIAMTIHHDEWIVSQRLAGLLADAGLTGFELAPVRHKSQYQDDTMDFRATPKGREVLRRAEAAGYPHPSAEFWYWLNRAEQRALVDQMRQEWVAMRTERERRRAKAPPVWYQLKVKSARVICVAPTRFGLDPFDKESRHRCPRLASDPRGEHVAGGRPLSEFFVDRDSYDGSDIVQTREYGGWSTRVARQAGAKRGGGSPFLLVSPRFRRLLLDYKIRGWKTDVAYLCRK